MRKAQTKPLQALFAVLLISCLMMASRCQNPAAPGDNGNGNGTKTVVAFPGAEGFGAKAIGGRGGRVIEVTNLNDSGPGSLRACLEASGPRICVFRKGGTIAVNSPLRILNPFITIAGQTAPGGGITLRNAAGSSIDATLSVQTHDVVIRYLTVRRGPGGAGDALEIAEPGIDKAYNVIIDHCSFSWGVDETVSTWYAAHDITIQWSIVSESLDCSTHPKGCHSKGLFVGSYASDEDKTTPGARDISLHHNLMAHNGERNPQIKTAGLVDVVNNVSYNPFSTFSHVDMEDQMAKVLVNYVGNYFQSGPNTDEDVGIKAIYNTPIGAGIYIDGNVVRYRDGSELLSVYVVDYDSRQYLVNAKFTAPVVTTVPAAEAYDLVLAGAGSTKGLDCQGAFFWRRDAIDDRVINDVKNLTGRIIDDPADVGGWLSLEPGTACPDADRDGMPDAWEQRYGFDPNNAADNVLDADGDGYTNVEEFLNGTDPKVK